MRFLRAVLLVPVLLVLLAGSALAKGAPTHARLDPRFGRGGVAKTATALGEADVRLAVAPGGKSYVLQGLTVLGFGADGKPNHQFGDNGRVSLFTGEGVWATGITVSKGRVFVTGTIDKPDPQAWIISLLPDGTRNSSFGVTGEVQTTFEMPAPKNAAGTVEPFYAATEPTSIIVDPQGRPVIGGRTVTAVEPCAFGAAPHPVPFVARLTSSGLLDTTFAGRGFAILGERGFLDAMAMGPEGELATIDNQRVDCAEHESQWNSTTGRLTEAGYPSPLLDPARPILQMQPLLAVDQHGRSLVVQTEELVEEPGTIVRLLAGGAIDTTFGHDGGVPLAGRLQWVRALTVDAKGRPIIAGGRAGVELLRLQTNGEFDRKFSPDVVVKDGGRGNTDGAVGAIGLDARGRIYVAGWVESKGLKTGCGVQVTRFLPGS
jgi:hypothetical protein